MAKFRKLFVCFQYTTVPQGAHGWPVTPRLGSVIIDFPHKISDSDGIVDHLKGRVYDKLKEERPELYKDISAALEIVSWQRVE